MKTSDFKKGDVVLVRCGVGLMTAKVASVHPGSGQLKIQPVHGKAERILAGFVLERYTPDGKLLQKRRTQEKQNDRIPYELL